MAGAYGIAVSLLMAITTLLAAVVAFPMLTWRSGVKLVERARGALRQPEEDLIESWRP